MPPHKPADQIRFLTNVRRLLAEGLLTAKYKYALIAALADLSVEWGDDSGSPLPLSTFAIAEKFVDYYWRHAISYHHVERRARVAAEHRATGHGSTGDPGNRSPSGTSCHIDRNLHRSHEYCATIYLTRTFAAA